MDKKSSYETISGKIKALKESFHSLRNESDEHTFAVLCVKANLYKNPSLSFTDEVIEGFLVDSKGDGGIDAILTDPNSETSNLVLCQAKYYQEITFDQVRDAVAKMILFYKSMKRGEYDLVNAKVQRRFLSLDAEVGDESKVCFIFYTSAPKSRICEDRVQKLLQEHGLDSAYFEIQLYFADDVVDEIKESESRRPTVESGKITIDQADNFLVYNDEEAVIVNVSAFSIKELFATHSTNLLSRNLRYFVKKPDIDKSINATIDNDPEEFWFRNNGLTIICDDFNISGKEVKLKNFSIVNGGQTTYLIYKNKKINKEFDFYLPCKIIKTQGGTEDEKNLFSLEIAKATNSQKAIKQIDLKANAPEQVRFGIAMRNVGIFYQTKRGEEIPKDYKEDYKNTDLVEVGKLCLAGMFQLPGSSRSRPSMLYADKFYNLIFNDDSAQVCRLVRELLYIDSYYRKFFIQKFDKEYEDSPLASEVIPFAHNARTICIAFAVFAARFYNKSLTSGDLKIIFNNVDRESAYDDFYYDIFRDISGAIPLMPNGLFDSNKDEYDSVLYNLFKEIILAGSQYYSTKKDTDSTLNQSNFLKVDRNYFAILKFAWYNIAGKIMEIFKSI